MRPRDLPCHELIVVSDVRRGIPLAVLELDVETHPELLHVEGRVCPVDPDSIANAASLLG